MNTGCRSHREKLPQRRTSVVISFKVGNVKYHATVGYYDSGMSRPGEIFLNAGKIGSDVETMMRDSAIAASLALQHGVSLHDLRQAMCRTEKGDAMGPLGVLLDLLAAGGQQ